MTRPLIAPAWRRAAAVAGLAGALLFLVLAVVFFHGHRSAFDTWAFRELPRLIGPHVATFLLQFTDPALSVMLLAVTVVLAASSRRFDVVLLAVVAPTLGTVLASDVAKPLIHRTLFAGTAGTFPSGHETGVTCTAVVLLIAFGLTPLRRGTHWALAALLALWIVIAAVALTRNYYHHATDTIGAIGLSVALVLGLAALLDRIAARWPGVLRAAEPDPLPGGPVNRSTPIGQLTPRD